MARALERLKISRVLGGFRGAPAANRQALLDTLEKLSALAADEVNRVRQIEINPLFAGIKESCAVDVLMQRD